MISVLTGVLTVLALIVLAGIVYGPPAALLALATATISLVTLTLWEFRP